MAPRWTDLPTTERAYWLNKGVDAELFDLRAERRERLDRVTFERDTSKTQACPVNGKNFTNCDGRTE